MDINRTYHSNHFTQEVNQTGIVYALNSDRMHVSDFSLQLETNFENYRIAPHPE